MRDLFEAEAMAMSIEHPAPDVLLLRNFATSFREQLFDAVAQIQSVSPFRQMQTPGGYQMSVAITNCGDYGWVTDHQGYRYSAIDPLTQQSWPLMPPCLKQLATDSAAQAGYSDFEPDVCLINRYEIGARMSLHQDKDETDFSQPIVSISLGLPAVFQLGGMQRSDSTQRILLSDGDVLVWGRSARLRFHGVLPVKAGRLPDDPTCRLNLTFRKAK